MLYTHKELLNNCNMNKGKLESYFKKYILMIAIC